MSKSLLINGQPHRVSDIRRDDEVISGCVDDISFSFRIIHRDNGWVVLADEQGTQHRLYVGASDAKGTRSVMMAGIDVALSAAGRQTGSAQGASKAISPMPGTVQAIRVQMGDMVQQGDVVAVMEAMKMQIAIAAPYAGVVKAVCVSAGQQIAEGVELVQIEASDV